MRGVREYSLPSPALSRMPRMPRQSAHSRTRISVSLNAKVASSVSRSVAANCISTSMPCRSVAPPVPVTNTVCVVPSGNWQSGPPRLFCLRHSA